MYFDSAKLKAKKTEKTIMRSSIIYRLYYLFMCVHWLKYVMSNRKDRLKNMRGTTLKVAMLNDVSGAHSAISSIYLCVTEPSDMDICHALWMAVYES